MVKPKSDGRGQRGKDMDLNELAKKVGAQVYPAGEGPGQTAAPALLPTAPKPWQERFEGKLKKVSYTHDAMIDLIIQEPMISQGEIAAYFGYSQAWVSQVINSDAFQARLAARKGDLTDPLIVKSIEERVSAAAQRSLDKVLESLDTASPEYALKVAQTMLSAKGFGPGGAKQAGSNNVAVIVNIPQKAPDADTWASRYAGTQARSAVVDVEPGQGTP